MEEAPLLTLWRKLTETPNEACRAIFYFRRITQLRLGFVVAAKRHRPPAGAAAPPATGGGRFPGAIL